MRKAASTSTTARQLGRLAGVAGAVVWLAMVTAAWAQDTVHLASGGRTGGRVIDYTGRQLVLELAGGLRRTIPGDQVVAVETTKTPQEADGDRAAARGDFGAALALYRVARQAEPRVWVRRQLTAKIVWCHRALGQLERACREFLVLIASDPQTPELDCIPLAWLPTPPPVALEQSAEEWVAGNQGPAVALLGASHLLSTAARPRALNRLKQLALGSDRAVALLAVAQTWRTQVATVAPEQLEAWQRAIETMPHRLRAGPYYVLAQGWRNQGQWEQAALALMRIAILYRRHYRLAGQSLWEAGQMLERLDRPEQASRLYRELVGDFSNTPASPQAADRLKELARTEG
ncbi:MAG TPA: hypothetical protein EYP56_22815 [Planctomycetaceae bacterium]|nr:hypothetical protein [Planctomycetaceae bacterium]